MESAFRAQDILPSLEQALRESTKLKIASGTRELQLTLLHSQARRTYSLFPWTADVPANKTYQEDFLLACSERLGPNSQFIPVYALEGCLFSLPETNSRLAYIAKVDTTGLSSHPSPAKVLTSAFLSKLLAASQQCNFRLHVFAKPATQYLFPASAENANKKQLEDKQLAKWWMRILAHLDVPPHTIQEGHALIPGLEWPEVTRLLSPMPSNWSVGLPMTPITVIPPERTPTLGDLIPCFPDDPKSRYMSSLTSSPLGPAGEKGDYDEQTKWLHHNNAGPNQISDFEEQREKEKSRLATTDNNAFLEGLAWRQECCAGGLVGFFVVSSKPHLQDGQKAVQITPSKSGLSHHAYIKLWNSFHNTTYHVSSEDATKAEADWQKIAEVQKSWIGKVKAESESQGVAVSETVIEKASENPALRSDNKRKADDTEAVAPAQPKVMMLKPRKKTKPAPESIKES